MIANSIDTIITVRIGPKLAKESYIGASGLSASEIKKAGQSVVEVHRGGMADSSITLSQTTFFCTHPYLLQRIISLPTS